MKAIHNTFSKWSAIVVAVNYTQRYKKWKQFTTDSRMCRLSSRLWTIHKDTKNESNSQHRLVSCLCVTCCELYTKIQKMKAIHNTRSKPNPRQGAVNYTQRYKKWKQFTTSCHKSQPCQLLWTIHKDTKNESNSQRAGIEFQGSLRCELYTKIQKMKAIHNACAECNKS